VQFAAQTSRAGQVPAAYVGDLLVTASKNLDDIATEIDKSTDVNDAARADAGDACRRLSSLMREADRDRRTPDERQLRDIELQLRASAQTARGGLPPRHAS
jgi:hypothetical protein